MVENSWGAGAGYQGHLIMTDEWFNEYTFRLVVETKYVTPKALEVLKQKPIRLPAWDQCLPAKNNQPTNTLHRLVRCKVFRPTLLKNVCEHKRNYGYFP